MITDKISGGLSRLQGHLVRTGRELKQVIEVDTVDDLNVGKGVTTTIIPRGCI